MFKSQKNLEQFIDEVRPQIKEIAKKTMDITEDDGVMVWISKGRIEFSTLIGERDGYKETFTIEGGKCFTEVTISKKVEG